MHAGELVREIATHVGGGGGGKPTMAQAGGKDADKLSQALDHVPTWISTNLKPQ
jgi:alanyl-tRNA synthetase